MSRLGFRGSKAANPSTVLTLTTREVDAPKRRARDTSPILMTNPSHPHR
jgi:hypothetical protein